MLTGYLVNGEIKAREVRLINEQDQHIVIATREALFKAQAVGLDLVVINDAVPPVAKILDYDKFRYESLKRDKELQKKARAAQTELKEIQLRPVTDIHDIEIKAKKAQQFLVEGDKVKIIVKFKGREVSHAEMGRTILETMLNSLTNHKIEKPIALNGRDMVVIVAPLKNLVPQA